MLRRSAIGILLSGACARAAGRGSLDAYLDAPGAAAALVDVPARRLIAVGGGELASRSLQPPGSALKPFVLSALLESGRLKPNETFRCTGHLRIRNRSFDCIHPTLADPLSIEEALAYSCNSFVAHMAQRFQPGELAHQLARFGLGSSGAPSRIQPASNMDDQCIQALGEDRVVVSAAGLAMAYRSLALKLAPPIRAGLEGAVEFGTAQNARIDGANIAGKTGSAINSSGEPVAWFAGFLPSLDPKAALAVMLPGRSGGSDAAPIARRIFEAYRAGKL